jgi:hypothetical protein
MANAYLLDHAEPPRSGSTSSLRAEHFLPYALDIARQQPGYLASIGMDADAYAASLAQPGLTIEESVEAGEISAAEGRFLQGVATAEDLVELGYSAQDVAVILEEQEARAASRDPAGACASST